MHPYNTIRDRVWSWVVTSADPSKSQKKIKIDREYNRISIRKNVSYTLTLNR